MEKYLKSMLNEHLGVAVREFVENAKAAQQPEVPYEAIVSALCRRFSEAELQNFGLGEYIAPYFEAKRKQLHERIDTCTRKVILETYPCIKPQKDGTYVQELFADYDDYLRPESIQLILSSPDPKQAFAERMEWGFDEKRAIERNKLVDKIVPLLEDPDLDDDVDTLVDEALMETLYLDAPTDHFLKQEVRIDIQMDTGTGHRGFCEILPDGTLDEQAAMLWLAQQQSYTEDDLRTALTSELEHESAFLRSAKREIEKATDRKNILTFPVRMTLRQALDLAEAVKLQDRDGHFNDTTKNPDCGTVTLGADVRCGLYNPWNGSGGPIGIELERDVVIPIRFIHDLVVAYNSHKVGRPYIMMEAFGLCASVWKDAVKSIDPIKLAE